MDDAVKIAASESVTLEAAVADYFGRLDRGERVEVEELIATHPGCELELHEFLQKDRRLQELAKGSHSAQNHTGQIIGDFRLIRELGRGGMGVVYEAEQLSLGRCVALKVLPFAAMLDKQQLARFKNEARAAATLDHPHVVAVYSVGNTADIHYYAMQLIEGRSLAQAIAAIRQASYVYSLTEKDSHAAQSTDAKALSTAFNHADRLPRRELLEVQPTSSDFDDCLPLPKFASREYFRTVARLGHEAASALDYAHQNGVLHRDIKPANLLLDETGKLWIADFGLARLESDASLTGTGDMLGTLRYMAPEQALAKRAVVDHRSDIYSLGATLYELLTLRPAFTESDPAVLLQQIAQDEPPAPRKANSNIPRDLETIVLKAMRKSVQDRYSSAQDLADDLQNFLDDKPIYAKRPTTLAIVRHWSRRHRPLVWASVATLVLSGLVVAASVGWTARDRAARQAIVDNTANIAIQEAKSFIEQRRWPQALAAVKRAEDVLAGQRHGALPLEAAALRKDIGMVIRLDDEIPDSDEIMLVSADSREHYDQLYLKFFRDFGIDVEVLGSQAAARKIRETFVPLQLALELDKWGTMRRRWRDPSPKAKPLFDIARLVDPDPVRNQIRDALEARTAQERKNAFDQLTDSFDGQSLPLQTTLLLAHTIPRHGTHKKALNFLRSVQRQFPGEFEINLELGYSLSQSLPPRWDEAVRYFTAAVSLRPKSDLAHRELGTALSKLGYIEDSITEKDEAARLRLAHSQEEIRLNPESAIAHLNLADNLYNRGRIEEAIAESREAVRLKPKSSASHNMLVVTLANIGHTTEAISEIREAIRLEPENAVYHLNLGRLLSMTNKHEEAIAAFQTSISLDPIEPIAHFELGQSLILHTSFTDEASSEIQQAIEGYRKSIELNPDDVESLICLAQVLTTSADLVQRNPAEAVRLSTKAVDLDPSAANWSVLGVAYYRAGNFQNAIEALQNALELRPGSYNEFFFAMAEWQLGNHKKAMKWYNKGNERMKQYPQVVGGEIAMFRAEAEELLGIHEPPIPEVGPTE